MIALRIVLAALLLVWVSASLAESASYYRFETTQQEARFQRLSEQLRCLVCQGQAIGDSNAELAKDMRAKVHELIVAGRSDAAVIEFMTDRYGDFVLYKPPVKPTTWALWFSPFVLAVVAVAFMLWSARRRSREPPAPLTAAEQERLRVVMDRDKT